VFMNEDFPPGEPTNSGEFYLFSGALLLGSDDFLAATLLFLSSLSSELGYARSRRLTVFWSIFFFIKTRTATFYFTILGTLSSR